jgi:hypothetical protein
VLSSTNYTTDSRLSRVIGTNSNPKRCARRTREKIRKHGELCRRRPQLLKRRKRSVHLTVALQSGIPNDNRRHRQTPNLARITNKYLRSGSDLEYGKVEGAITKRGV